MTRPFYIQLVAEIEIGSDAFARELVDDHAVINAADFNLAPVALVKQFITSFGHGGYANERYSGQLLGRAEIGKRLLSQRINFHQHDLFGIVAVEQNLAKRFDISLVRQSVEQVTQSGQIIKMSHVNARQEVLESIERREGLQFNQLRRQRPAPVPGNGEVDLDEVRTRAFVRRIEGGRNGAVGRLFVFGSKELADDLSG